MQMFIMSILTLLLLILSIVVGMKINSYFDQHGALSSARKDDSEERKSTVRSNEVGKMKREIESLFQTKFRDRLGPHIRVHVDVNSGIWVTVDVATYYKGQPLIIYYKKLFVNYEECEQSDVDDFEEYRQEGVLSQSDEDLLNKMIRVTETHMRAKRRLELVWW
jgi:hypothetical protein